MRTNKQIMNEIVKLSDEMVKNINAEKKGAFIFVATDETDQVTSYAGSNAVMFSMLMNAMLSSKDIADVILLTAQEYLMTEITKDQLTNDIN